MSHPFSNLIVKGPFKLSGDVFYRIYQRKENSKDHYTLITPQVCISSCLNDKGLLSFSVDDISATSKTGQLCTQIKLLEQSIKKQFAPVPKKEGCCFRSCINEWQNNRYVYCRLSSGEINCFNIHGNTVQNGLQSIRRGSLVRLLLWFKGLYIGKKYWGIQLVVLQVRIYDISPPIKCLITDEETPEKKTSSDVKYQTYRRMKSMGVPIAAIRHKIIQDGENPDQVIPFLSAKETRSESARPQMGGLQLLQGLQGATLRKASQRVLPKKQKPRQAPSNQLVPSLEDILRIKNHLQPIK